MNIIGTIKALLESFPHISTVCNAVSVDFSEDYPESYGLCPVGDSLISEDIIGNQIRRHNFTLYATLSSISDYERLSNSGTLLELANWLDSRKPEGIQKITTSNGMLYEIPSDNYQSPVRYQLQIAAEYTVDAGEVPE